MKPALFYLILWFQACWQVYAQLAVVNTVKVGGMTYVGYQILCDLSKDEIIAKLLTHYQHYKIRPFVHENTVLVENTIYPAIETDKKLTIQYLIEPEGNTNAVKMVVWYNKTNVTPQNFPEMAEKAKQSLAQIFEGHLLKQNTVFNPIDEIVQSSSIEQRLASIENTLKNIEAKLSLTNNINQMPVTSFEDALKLKLRSEQISLKEKELLKREAELEDVDFALQAKQKALQEKEIELKKLSDSIQKQIKYLEKLAQRLNVTIKKDDSVTASTKLDSLKNKSIQDLPRKELDTLHKKPKYNDSLKKIPRGFVVPKKDTIQKEIQSITFKGTPVKYNPVPYTELTPEQIDTLKYLQEQFIQEQFLKTPQKSLPCFTFTLDMNLQEAIGIITAYMAGLGCTQYELKGKQLKYQLNQGIPLLKITKNVECLFYLSPIDEDNCRVDAVFEIDRMPLTRKTNPNAAFELERLILHIMGKL
ncbi:MAG: hypothetical protein NZ455_07320 [Bacteroidia bacterium]|nr:hypothetical protein [Bacteroidia bacterium]MDW8301960.1 hypothetical protein [Bacteroidia bacterium]